MRIAFVQKNFHPNSVGLIEGLVGRGHEVLNLVQYIKGTKSGAGEVDVTSVVIPYGRSSAALLRRSVKTLDRRALPRFRPLLSALARYRPDVVIVRETRAVALVAAAIGRTLGARTILMWDKPKSLRKMRLLATLGRPLLPRRRIHMGHFGSIGTDIRLLGVGRSRLLPYPVELGPDPRRRLEAVLADPQHRVRIVAVGSLNNARKRNPMLIDAIVRAGVADEVDVTFIGLGHEGSSQLLEIRAKEQHWGITPSQILLNIAHPEVLERLADQHIFVIPSRNEPFSVVVPEAMSRGLPVICSDTNGARVCFVEGESGFVFPTDSVDVLADRIRQLVRDRQLLHRMSLAAYERARTELAPDVWAERFERLVEEGHRSTERTDDQRVMSSGEPPG
jgi:glycosyltransferase involved in cell wall biosynthesis